MAGNGGVNGSMPQYGDGGFGQKAGDGRKGRLGRVLVRSDVEFSRVQISLVLREVHLFIDLPIKLAKKWYLFARQTYWDETI